ncbi:MAG: LuxR C-terminal-related transcriptional regulator [Legionella sp.]|nr:LuxR C-terminal-related transcriptional regulator [Legionella sp.]
MNQLAHTLQIYRFAQGIKLITPKCPLAVTKPGQKTNHTVGSVLSLPFNFYFLNTQGTTQLMNEESALMCGFTSANDAIGKSLFDVSDEKSATHLINNCAEVINSNSAKIFEEQNIRKDGLSLQFLSIKCPWYDETNEIIGVFGCSIVLGTHSLAASLSAVMELNLFDYDTIPSRTTNPTRNLKSTTTYLSKRELECLHLTIKGYTAKRIGRELGISHRTVEEYLVNIRIKIGASSKAELIEMTIDEFISMDFS